MCDFNKFSAKVQNFLLPCNLFAEKKSLFIDLFWLKHHIYVFLHRQILGIT